MPKGTMEERRFSAALRRQIFGLYSPGPEGRFFFSGA
jgi:hypothetical protein